VDYVRTLLEQQPLAALFLTIAIGYLMGEINIKGFSLGVGAVLFVALAVGWFAPKAVPAPMVGTIGLALFLYAVGVQYGRQFFLGLTSAAGQRANIIALIGVLLSGAASIVIVKTMGLDLGHGLGLFAGSGTSTPTLQAAIATLGNDDPAVGYSVSYPFGVAGPILLLYFGYMILKPKIETGVGAGMELLEVALRNPTHFSKTLGEVMSGLPGSWWRKTMSCWSSRQPRRRLPRQAARLASRRPAAWSRIAATSIMCASSPRARWWWAGRSAISTCRATRRRSSPR
jgi:putative transport protein